MNRNPVISIASGCRIGSVPLNRVYPVKFFEKDGGKYLTGVRHDRFGTFYKFNKNSCGINSMCYRKNIDSANTFCEVYFGGPDLPPFKLRNLLAEHIALVPQGGSIDKMEGLVGVGSGLKRAANKVELNL